MNRHDRLAQASQDRKKSRAALKFQAQKAAKEVQRQAMLKQLGSVLPELSEAAAKVSEAIHRVGEAMANLKIRTPYSSDPANETEQEKTWRAYATSRRWA